MSTPDWSSNGRGEIASWIDEFRKDVNSHIEDVEEIAKDVDTIIKIGKTIYDLIREFFRGDDDPRAWISIVLQGENGFSLGQASQMDGGDTKVVTEMAEKIRDTLNNLLDFAGIDKNTVRYEGNTKFHYFTHFEDNFFLVEEYIDHSKEDNVRSGIFTNLQNPNVALGTKSPDESYFELMLVKILEDVDFSKSGISEERANYIEGNISSARNYSDVVGRITEIFSYSEVTKAPIGGQYISQNRGDNSYAGNKMLVFARRGDDDVGGAGASQLLDGGSGSDTIRGRAGNDTIVGGRDDDLLFGGVGADQIFGGEGSDTLYGQSGGDYILGNSPSADGSATAVDGRDNIYGGEGADTLLGNQGRDLIRGGEGNDLINGGRGRDTIDGGAGNDTLSGGLGTDELFGGLGNDEYHHYKGARLSLISDSGGSDTLFLHDINRSQTVVKEFSKAVEVYVAGQREVRILHESNGESSLEKIVFDDGSQIFV